MGDLPKYQRDLKLTLKRLSIHYKGEKSSGVLEAAADTVLMHLRRK